MELSLNRGVSLEHAPSHELFSSIAAVSRTPLVTRELKATSDGDARERTRCEPVAQRSSGHARYVCRRRRARRTTSPWRRAVTVAKKTVPRHVAN